MVIEQTIENYQSEILRLTAGCSVIVTGKVVASPAQGQAVEMQAQSRSLVVGRRSWILIQWRQNAIPLNIYVKYTYVHVPI